MVQERSRKERSHRGAVPVGDKDDVPAWGGKGHPKGNRLARPARRGTGAQGASRAARRQRYAAKVCSPSSPLTGSESHRPPSGPARSWASGVQPPWRTAPSGPWAAPLPAPASSSNRAQPRPSTPEVASHEELTHAPHSLLGGAVRAPVAVCTGAVLLAHAQSSMRKGSWVRGTEPIHGEGASGNSGLLH